MSVNEQQPQSIESAQPELSEVEKLIEAHNAKSKSNDIEEIVEENEKGKTPHAESIKKAIEMRKKFKLLVDGKEEEEELDLNDEKTLTELLQLRRGYSKRRDEIKKEKEETYKDKQQLMSLWEQMQKDPLALAKKQQNYRDILEQELFEFIKVDAMTQEQKEALALKKQLEEYKQKELEFKKQQEAEELKKQQDFYAGKFQKDLIAASEKAGLGKNPEIIKIMAKKMLQNLEYGLDLSPDEIAEELKEETRNMYKTLLNSGDESFIENLLDKDVLNKIRKSDIKKLQEKQMKSKEKEEYQPRKSKEEKTMSLREWRESLNK